MSNDQVHDFHIVQTFIEKVWIPLHEQEITINCKIQFSDGCAGQCKSKGPFVDISQILSAESFYHCKFLPAQEIHLCIQSTKQRSN